MITTSCHAITTDLWGDEVGGVAWRHEEPVLRAELLGEAEVDDAERVGVAASVAVQNVGRLQVAVHNLGEEGINNRVRLKSDSEKGT